MDSMLDSCCYLWFLVINQQTQFIFIYLLTNQQNEKIHFIETHVVHVPVGNGV